MNIKQLKEQIKLRYSANAYANLSDRERKLYRVGFKTGYKLAREYFKTNTIVKQNTVIKEVIKYVTINDVVVPMNVKHVNYYCQST
jgi:hypothetical protein